MRSGVLQLLRSHTHFCIFCLSQQINNRFDGAVKQRKNQNNNQRDNIVEGERANFPHNSVVFVWFGPPIVFCTALWRTCLKPDVKTKKEKEGIGGNQALWRKKKGNRWWQQCCSWTHHHMLSKLLLQYVIILATHFIHRLDGQHLLGVHIVQPRLMATQAVMKYPLDEEELEWGGIRLRRSKNEEE